MRSLGGLFRRVYASKWRLYGVQPAKARPTAIGVKHFQTIHHTSVDVAHGLALLFGIGTKALPVMGFEDEVEQSLGRPCRHTDGRSKRTYELTSSIVPRGTSFHRWVELEFPPIAFDPDGFHACCDLPGPPELGAVNPYAVHDYGQPARQRHDRLLHPAVPGDRSPRPEPMSISPTHQLLLLRVGHHQRHHTPQRDIANARDLARLTRKSHPNTAPNQERFD